MKKVVLGGSLLTLVLTGFTACNKEDINTVNRTNATEKTITNGSYTYAEQNRSYKWVENNTKLDCSAAGKGCTVKAKYVSADGEIDLSSLQVLRLMQIGQKNVNEYFVKNDLSYEFPNFYESSVFGQIEANEITLNFEFPYLTVLDIDGEVMNIYNYESTLSDASVVAALQAAGGYTKKISVNTGSGGPWKCTEDGDNCKVSAVKFNLDWLASNPMYTFAPNIDWTTTSVIKDNENRKILVQTDSGLEYGIEL